MDSTVNVTPRTPSTKSEKFACTHSITHHVTSPVTSSPPTPPYIHPYIFPKIPTIPKNPQTHMVVVVPYIPTRRKQSQVPRGARRWGFRGPPPPPRASTRGEAKQEKKNARAQAQSAALPGFTVYSAQLLRRSLHSAKRGPDGFFNSRIGWLGFSASAVPLGSPVPCWCVLYPFLLG